MTTQTASTNLIDKEVLQTTWLQRLGLFIVFLFCETAIFIFGSYYFDVFPTNKNLTFNLIVSAVFLTTSLWFKYDKHLNRYWRIAFVFFIASVAYPFSAIFDGWIRATLSWFAATTDTSKGLAIEKVCEMLLKTVPILVLVKLSGADFGSVFIKRGNLKLGLGIGALVFFFLGTATFMFAVQRFTSVDTLVAAVVWGLVFSFANSFMEELWLRGIFLKRFEPMLGLNGSVWLTSIIFASIHSFAFYFMPTAIPFFFINTLALGLACGYLIMKSDSLWGAVVIHAASDFFLFVAVLANA
ncbi:MAG TPA: CPBP family intramembrane glutamic endopeptidase [Anaerolineales bacterium]